MNIFYLFYFIFSQVSSTITADTPVAGQPPELKPEEIPKASQDALYFLDSFGIIYNTYMYFTYIIYICKIHICILHVKFSKLYNIEM